MAKKTTTKPAPQSRQDQARDRIQQRMDGWRSTLSGLGGLKDKRTYSRFIAEQMDYFENIDLWRGDDLAGRIVEIIPNEMMREGWELNVEGDRGKEIQSDVTGLLEDLDFNHKLWQALATERAVGGAGILLGSNDLRSFSQPLNLKSVASLTFLETFEPLELTAARWQNDPTIRGFGTPSAYRLNPVSPGGSKKTGVEIHESRLLIFPGIRVSRRQITVNSGWGDAVLTRCRETLRDFQTSWAAAGLLIADFAQAVWKIKGLAEIIALDKGSELANRIAAMTLSQSIVRATVIDADGEEYERKQTPVTGLPELLDRFATRLAASADIPVTRLMGMSPAGLNATGDSDIRTFYDRVKADQNRKLRPVIEKAVRVAFASLGYEEPEDWSIKFHPLWQPTEKEQAETRKLQMETDSGYIDHQVVSAGEVRTARFSGREYSYQLQVEPDSVIEPIAPQVDASSPEYQALIAQGRRDFIEHRGSSWLVLSTSGEVLGTHDNEADAQAQLAAIEAAKKVA